MLQLNSSLAGWFALSVPSNLKGESGCRQASSSATKQCSLTETGCQMKVAMCSCPTVRKLDNIDVEPAQNHLCSSVERVQKESKSQPCQNQ